MILSDNARGVGFMCIAMAAFTGNDALMKAVTETVPLMQAILIRGALSAAMLLALASVVGGIHLALPKADRGKLGLRTLAELAATLTFLTALMHMPLANLSAILQALPLAVTLAAALVFAEPVGWRRMSAIAVGFVGVLMIVRPGTAGFDVWSVVGVVSMLCVVVRDLATRRLSVGLPSVTVAFYTAVAVGLMGAAGVALQMVQGTGWQPVGQGAMVRLAGSSALLVFGYLFIVKAMRAGDVAMVAPFRYTSLLWAILLGWLVFGTLPDALTWAGAALIVASGLFTFWREARLRRSHA
ncbi:MAG: DMT family transporter [Gemmobacter sp.]